MATIELTSPSRNDLENSQINLTQPEQRENLQHNAIAVEDVPPNGGYGWVCTFCVFLIIVHTWGINSAWGVILAHFLSHSTFPDASRIEYAFIGGLSICQALLIGPLVIKSQKMIGTTITLLIGTAIEFTSLFGAAYATQVWHLFLTQGVCFGVGMGFLYIPAMAVLPLWFSTRRSFSIGLAGSGAGIGGLVYNLATGYSIEKNGVQMTYKILAFCALGSNLVSSLLLKPRHTSQPEERYKRTINLRDLSRLEVLLMMVWGIATEFGYIALIYSLPDYAASIGLTAQQGSVTGAILNLGLTLGRPLVGYLSDKCGRITVPTILTAFCGVACLAIWVPAHSYPVLLVFALVSGMFCGIFWGAITPVMAEIVGLGRLPATFTLICLTLAVPTAVAEPIAMSLVNGSGYLNAQIYVGCMFFLGSFMLWILRSWKCYEVEKKAADEREGLAREGSSAFPSFLHWMRIGKLFVQARV
ncbi:MFS general substrate transporter [Penicillium capsulatum]|uniref:MFS general substrate transporter n=1 Tax=Penicillium capsulatum TaxID=69766 RepID=A0A9W9LPX5_9EURO|nr:MFS general substrate transporter [Penicillium capsulatum]KAJ6136574.1 MFS general substrate transporter [Penicillium capsulatum]